MSENQVNSKRNWKAQTFPFDHYIPDETEECLYCLTDKQAELLRGIIEPVGWKTRWYSETNQTVETDTVEKFRDEIIRRLMMSCCGNETPIRYRYTDEGILQQSTDDGETWEDAPNRDPRNYSPLFPPIADGGEDLKCSAATGAITLMKEQIKEQLTDDMTRYTLSELINDWVTTYISTSNPFQALITVVVNQIFALVIAVVKPALTDEVFEDLKCILYCNMSPDASFTSEQWDEVRNQTTEKISGVAGIFLEHLIYLLGAVGLTNLVRANPIEGDCNSCSDCVEQPCSYEWSIGNVPGFPGEGVIDSQDGFTLHAHATNLEDGTYRIILKTASQDACCTISVIDTNEGASFTAVNYINCDSSQTYENIQPWTGPLIDMGIKNYLGFSSIAYFEIDIHFTA